MIVRRDVLSKRLETCPNTCDGVYQGCRGDSNGCTIRRTDGRETSAAGVTWFFLLLPLAPRRSNGGGVVQREALHALDIHALG